MKSKILSFNTLKETAKKQVWVPALIVLGFFLSLPVLGMVYLEILQSGNKTAADIIYGYTQFLSGIHLPFLMMMVMGSAVLTGVSGFSWLHSRVKTDFYHSLPIRRGKLFLNQIVLGILYFVVPYIVNLLLAYVVAMVHGILRGNMIRVSLQSFLYHCLFYLLIYLVAVLAMLLTGKILAGILGAVVLVSYGPVLSVLLNGMKETFFDTYVNRETGLNRLLQGVSPVFSYIKYQPDSRYVISGKVWGLGVLGVMVLTALCFYLYKKRPSEAAGHTMTFFRLGKLIQYMMEVLVILSSGLLLYVVTVRVSMGWMIFGILLGGILFHGVMEVIYEGDIRRVMSHVWVLGASVVTCLVVVGMFYGDVFGYDDFFPKQDELERLRIQVTSSQWSGEETYNQEELTSMEKLAKDPHVYEVLEELMKNKLDTVKTLRGMERRKPDGSQAEDIKCIQVEYGLSRGKTAARVYYVDYSQYRQQILSLYDNQDYKKTVYPLLTMTDEEMEQLISELTVISIMEDYETLFSGNARARADFLKTYRAELMQLDQKAITEELPIGCLEMASQQSSMDGMTQEQANIVDTINSLSYYIYPSFTKTLAALKEQGVELPTSYLPEDVKSITVYDYRDRSDDSDQDISTYEHKIRDREKIQELLPYLISTECNNEMARVYESVTAMVVFRNKSYEQDVYCMILRDWNGDFE